MRVTYNTRQFEKEMKNFINYSIGFMEGIQYGKNVFLTNLGKGVIERLKQFIDANARLDPESLHHVYEWYETGSPEARLFDLTYVVIGGGLSINSTFRQSTSVRRGSNVPFYNKAEIMENGIPVVIKPRKADVLAFEADGEAVFTKNPIRVTNPGGNVQGEYEKVFNMFFDSYFTQAYLQDSGMIQYLSSPTIYKQNLPAGKRAGKSVGVNTGYKWITGAGDL